MQAMGTISLRIPVILDGIVQEEMMFRNHRGIDVRDATTAPGVHIICLSVYLECIATRRN